MHDWGLSSIITYIVNQSHKQFCRIFIFTVLIVIFSSYKGYNTNYTYWTTINIIKLFIKKAKYIYMMH